MAILGEREMEENTVQFVNRERATSARFQSKSGLIPLKSLQQSLKINHIYIKLRLICNIRRRQRGRRVVRENPHRINDFIRVSEVRLVGDNVEMGVYSTDKAKDIARELELDLVENFS